MDRTLDIQPFLNTDATRGLVMNGRVYDPLLFSRRTVHFSRREYYFLHHYRFGAPLETACKKAGLRPERALSFLKRGSVKAWLRDRARMDHIKREWEEPGKWWAMGNEVLEGRRRLSKDQQVVYQMFGDRVCPKSKEPEESAKKTVINFNFGEEAVQDAFRRQESIEADLAKERA